MAAHDPLPPSPIGRIWAAVAAIGLLYGGVKANAEPTIPGAGFGILLIVAGGLLLLGVIWRSIYIWRSFRKG